MRADTQDAYPNAAVPAISYALEDLVDRTSLQDALLLMLGKVIPCDAIAWNYIDVVSGTAFVEGHPSELFEGHPEWWGLMLNTGDHPMITSYLDDPTDVSPRRMSDVVTFSELHRTRAYADLLKPSRSERQMTAISGRSLPGGARSFTFVREVSDFSDEELDLLTSLQPVLIALDAQLSRINPSKATAAHGLKTLKNDPTLTLTPRERQILALVAQGVTAVTCAHVLRIAERTVRKHLENIYAKLGCHDRMMAVHRARALGLIG